MTITAVRTGSFADTHQLAFLPLLAYKRLVVNIIYEAPLRVVRGPPITSTPNVRATSQHIRKYVVLWLKRSG